MNLTSVLILGIVGVGPWIVWGFVVLKLANKGVEHPEHQNFFMELVRSKKSQLPSAMFQWLNSKEKEKKKDDDGD
jgi:hypothetical protein